MKSETSAWISWVMRPIVNLADVARETTRELESLRTELIQLREESQRLRRERPHLCGFHIFATRGIEIKKGRTFRRASGSEVKVLDQNWIWGDQRFLAPGEIHCFTHYPQVSLKEGFIVTWGACEITDAYVGQVPLAPLVGASSSFHRFGALSVGANIVVRIKALHVPGS